MHSLLGKKCENFCEYSSNSKNDIYLKKNFKTEMGDDTEENDV